MRCNPAFSSIHQVKSHCGGPTVWYPHAVWSHHDDEPMHHHAAADDRPPACRHQLRATAVDRRPDGSTCCDRVVGEIDVVCCQMWRKWRARIEENCPRSVGPTNHADQPPLKRGSMLLLLLMLAVMCYAEPDDSWSSHAERARPTANAVDSSADNTTTAVLVPSTDRPDANSIILPFNAFLFTRSNNEMVLLNLQQHCLPASENQY